MKYFRESLIKLLCAILIVAWAPVALSQEGQQVGDMSFWAGHFPSGTAQGGPGYFGEVNGVPLSYASFWIAKQNGGVFDVSSFRVTILSPWEGLYYVSGYRNGVQVFEQEYGIDPYLTGGSIPGDTMSFNTDIQGVDLFVIRAAIAGDGYHSRVDMVSGTNLDFMQTGMDTWFGYADRNIDFDLGDTGNIGPTSTLTAILEDGYIGTLQIAFPVVIDVEGDYTATFVLKNSLGQTIKLFNWSSYLTTGTHTIMVEADAEEMLAYDGPYSINTVVLKGPASDISFAMSVPAETVFSRWQYYPRYGLYDIDGNGYLDQDDLALLTTQRNQPVYSPGDRRDLNRDGKIDLKDIMLLRQQIM